MESAEELSEAAVLVDEGQVVGPHAYGLVLVYVGDGRHEGADA